MERTQSNNVELLRLEWDDDFQESTGGGGHWMVTTTSSVWRYPDGSESVPIAGSVSHQFHWIPDFKDATNRHVTSEQFLEFIKFYFKKEIGAIKRISGLNWEIGGRLKKDAYGITTQVDKKTILIQISQKALNDSKQLYLTVEHELIHALDLVNGNFESWSKLVRMDNWTEEYYEEMMDAVMEYHAYSVSVNTAIGFGVDPTRDQTELDRARMKIEDWGYLNFF